MPVAAAILLTLGCLAVPGFGEKGDEVPDDLTELTFFELLDVKVTSVSKRSEPLSDAAAAVYVLTGTQIERSGATSLAEALRLVPGLQVTRIDAHTYGVSARGFNGSVSDKLEVLMDGRSLYTPLFSGVFWEAQDALIEDIDRIEVIRGPGGTLWGANAVNGVINIVTKSSADTHGTLIGLGAGTERKWYGAVRTGHSIGEHAHLRAYGKAWEVDDGALPDGSDANDGLRMQHGGFRADWTSGERDRFTLQGDLYDGDEDDFSGETSLEGADILTRWTRSLEGGSEIELQAYYDRYERATPTIFGEKRETWDVSFQFSKAPGKNHTLTWGGGYRSSSDETARGVLVIFNPANRMLDTLNVFIQDQIAWGEDVTLTVGTKYEHNDLTGDELQPGIRIGWTPKDRHTLWASAARAVRIPNRLDHDLAFELPPGTPGFEEGAVFDLGNREFQSETLVAYEIGYRVSPTDNLTLDLASFFNDYDELRGIVSPAPGVFLLDNSLQGESWGIEISGTWRPAPGWLVQSGYSYLDLDLEPIPGRGDLGADAAEGNDPNNQAFMRTSVDITERWRLDALSRYADRLSNQDVPSYIELDLRLAFQHSHKLDVALVGRNLLHDQHPEFGGATATEVERSVGLQITIRIGDS